MERVRIVEISVLVLVLVLLVFGFYFISSGITKHTGLLVEDVDDVLVECFEGRGVKVYVDREDREVLKGLDYFEFLPYMEIFNCHNSVICDGEGVVVGEFNYGLEMSVEELRGVLGC
jgi:hypothetical protein